MTQQFGEENILALTEALALRKAASGSIKVNALLDEQHDRARKDLQEPVEIEDVDTFPKPADLYVDRRKWLRMTNVVAVSADLKDSTALSFNKYAQNECAALRSRHGLRGAADGEVRAPVHGHPGRRDLRPVPP